MNQDSISVNDKNPKTARGAKTKAKLIEAAVKEFGARGYHECMIADITKRANVAMGTFYVYFESKEEIFRELVQFMGQTTRAYISKQLEGVTNRLEAEKKGLVAFIEFARKNKDLYRIVMESQFVAEDAYRDYYNSFHKAYCENLETASKNGAIRDGDNDVRAWGLIGLSVFLGMRYCIWDDSETVENITKAAYDLIENGLKTG
jgi:AcrR family transcriptional regulator